MLENLTHRGAVGADPLMGDGAGVLVQIPDGFFREEMARQNIDLPPAGQYGVGHWFMPRDAALCAHIDEIIREVGTFRRTAADRLPRRAGRQFVAVEGAGHRRRRALSSPGLYRPHSPISTMTRSTRRGFTCCARSSPAASTPRTTTVTSAPIACRCRRAPSSTRACSSPTRSAPTTRICPIRASKRR